MPWEKRGVEAKVKDEEEKKSCMISIVTAHVRMCEVKEEEKEAEDAKETNH